MPARRILIVYGTSYGQTAKVARFIADLLTSSGDEVMLANAAELTRNVELPRNLSPRDFHGVVVGSSVIVGRHQRSVAAFVRAHRDALDATPSAFFSVSGSAASHDEEGRADARRMVDEFVRETGWRPGLTETVAGAMAFTKYNPLIRFVLRRISAKAGGPTDTSRDHELTDWDQVRRFAATFAAAVPPARVAPSPPPPLVPT